MTQNEKQRLGMAIMAGASIALMALLRSGLLG